MTRQTRRRVAGAVMACGALVIAACSDYEGELESQGVVPAASSEVQRSAGTDENLYWDTVDAAKGGHGWLWSTLGDDYCFATHNGDQGWNKAYYNLCFMLANETKRFTSERGLWSKFPLTVTRFYTGNTYPALGGANQSGYWGVLQGNKDCNSECNGRLSPNPFGNTAVMQFAGQGATGASETAGIKVRLFLNSGASPMRLSDASAQPEYDMPMWSSTNSHACNAGAWFTCIKDPNIPSSGSSVIARYRIGTLPLEVEVVNALGSKNTLRLRGDRQATNLLLDPIFTTPAIVPGDGSVLHRGYRAADGRQASLTATYVVADTAGNTTDEACKASGAKARLCGTTISMDVKINADGSKVKETATCAVSPVSSGLKCEVFVSGPANGPMTALVRVADF